MQSLGGGGDGRGGMGGGRRGGLCSSVVVFSEKDAYMLCGSAVERRQMVVQGARLCPCMCM